VVCPPQATDAHLGTTKGEARLAKFWRYLCGTNTTPKVVWGPKISAQRFGNKASGLWKSLCRALAYRHGDCPPNPQKVDWRKKPKSGSPSAG
jgi:hypothetical protein